MRQHAPHDHVRHVVRAPNSQKGNVLHRFVVCVMVLEDMRNGKRVLFRLVLSHNEEKVVVYCVASAMPHPRNKLQTCRIC